MIRQEYSCIFGHGYFINFYVSVGFPFNLLMKAQPNEKRYLQSFLIHIFDRKFKMAKEDATDRKEHKRLEGKEFDEIIEEAKKKLRERRNNKAKRTRMANRTDIANLQKKSKN